MKTRLDKCKIIYSDKHYMYGCGLFLDIAMKKSNLGDFFFKFFPGSINSVFSGTKREVEYKELFGKEVGTKWQHYIIIC